MGCGLLGLLLSLSHVVPHIVGRDRGAHRPFRGCCGVGHKCGEFPVLLGPMYHGDVCPSADELVRIEAHEAVVGELGEPPLKELAEVAVLGCAGGAGIHGGYLLLLPVHGYRLSSEEQELEFGDGFPRVDGAVFAGGVLPRVGARLQPAIAHGSDEGPFGVGDEVALVL